jgi:hypothetical protein
MNILKHLPLPIVLFGAIILSLTLLSACSDNSAVPPSDEENLIQLITSGTWILESVTIDGVEEPNLFKGMTLNMTRSTYSVVNGGKIWDKTNSWYPHSSSGKQYIYFSNLTMAFPVEIEHINQETLSFSFHWNTTSLAGGREKSLEGDHVFVFKK